MTHDPNVRPQPHELRDRLRYPIALVITILWFMAGLVALYRSDVQVFVIASGPFTILCGYLFGGEILRRAASNDG